MFRPVFRSERRLNAPGGHFSTAQTEEGWRRRRPSPLLGFVTTCSPRAVRRRSDLTTGLSVRTMSTCFLNAEQCSEPTLPGKSTRIQALIRRRGFPKPRPGRKVQSPVRVLRTLTRTLSQDGSSQNGCREPNKGIANGLRGLLREDFWRSV